MNKLEKNSGTFVLFNSHYQVYLAIGTGTLMIETNIVHTTTSPETARTFSVYAQAREFMNLLNEYHDKEFEAWGVINSEYIDFFCKVAEPQPQLMIKKSIADKLDDIFTTFIRERHSSSVWNLLWRAEEIDWEIGEQLSALLPDENQVNIAIAYLAGKALGVDLVKVVEG
ncbi:glycosyltransferase [Lactococcus phage AM2]|uniref:Glycosyltransferase n=8 Tax=Audreyjarvisvirus TaxID=2843351 RepID=A0A1W6JLF6_9CAUD|nr:glycosyltransferase [Lactococcus phage AM1]YP_009905174.1 hypothetical protein H1Z34_gp027 [Lactococcus phage LW81]ARM66329.1 glycosyltransferase [Lactococcus phage AM2]ARM66506.1 glycosyltransferase [Lactococcus phage AM3]ARM67059.1 glycosyltransferase [Lactococcus phage AM8]ARM67237.1 glycosyltransferase [Lactococcus phage AM9]ARM67416.1 glycosyltransferase [Lactococcus phage AM11]ARQ95604.1 glycosyltransferase [Lactococcus phage AM12]